MAQRSPHIVSHDLHEVEGHTEKDVLPKKVMSKFCRIGDAFDLKSSDSYFLLSIVSCIFEPLEKGTSIKARSFFVCEDSHKKDMSEF